MVLSNNRISIFQKWLKNTYFTIENMYYDRVDELTAKIDDLDLPGVEQVDIELREFSFITQWEQGILSSAKVCEIFKSMNIEEAAKTKLTKRLSFYMAKESSIPLRDYIKPTVDELNEKCVPLMIKYLNMLKTFFEKAAAMDKEQIPVTVMMQSILPAGIKLAAHEMSLNQAIKNIETFINDSAEQKFFISDQVIIFDEEIDENERMITYVFGPRTYIELIKVLFDIKEELGSKDAETQLKALINAYV